MQFCFRFLFLCFKPSKAGRKGTKLRFKPPSQTEKKLKKTFEKQTSKTCSILMLSSQFLLLNRFILPCFPKRTQRYIVPIHSTKRSAKIFEKYFQANRI